MEFGDIVDVHIEGMATFKGMIYSDGEVVDLMTLVKYEADFVNEVSEPFCNVFDLPSDPCGKFWDQ